MPQITAQEIRRVQRFVEQKDFTLQSFAYLAQNLLLDRDIHNVKIVFFSGARDRWNRVERVIYLGTPELIVTLHEVGHAIYGMSEEVAISYSEAILAAL